LYIHHDQQNKSQRFISADSSTIPGSTSSAVAISPSHSHFHTLLKLLTTINNGGNTSSIIKVAEARPRKAETESLVYFSLSLAYRLCPIEEIHNIIRETFPKAKKYYRKGIKEKTRSLSLQLRIGTTYPTEVEKALAEFNATNKFRVKLYYFLQTWKRLLFPPMMEAQKMKTWLNPNIFQRILIRITAPYRMMKYIASEISWLLLFAMMIKIFYDLIKSGFRAVFNIVFNKKGQTSVMDRIKSSGVSNEELKKIKENIQ
jgi:hypothetical protein